LPDGTSAGFAMTLCFRDDSDAAARIARDKGAQAHGLVSVVGVPRAPLHPVQWMMIKNALVTRVAEGDLAVSNELHRMLVKVMRTFFKDVRNVAPDLAGCSLSDDRPQNTANVNALAVSSSRREPFTSSAPRTG
jgi:hypothetical protein